MAVVLKRQLGQSLGQNLRQKMGSQEGASILMALFLFLICAALAAVILAAATAASGRVAGLAEADQKYYNVTSAAELVREMMGGDAGVSVKVTCTQDTVTTRSADGSTVTTPGAPTCTLDNDDTPIDTSDSNLSLTQQAAKTIVLAGKTGTGSSAAYAWDWQFGSSTQTSALSALDATAAKTLKLSGSNLSDKASAALNQLEITEQISPNGDIVIEFADYGKDGKPEATQDPAYKTAYKLKLTCTAECNVETKSKTTRNSSTGAITRTDTKIATITWKPTSLKQVPKGSSTNTEGGT